MGALASRSCGNHFPLAGRARLGQGGVSLVGRASVDVLSSRLSASSHFGRSWPLKMWTLASLSFPHTRRPGPDILVVALPRDPHPAGSTCPRPGLSLCNPGPSTSPRRP